MQFVNEDGKINCIRTIKATGESQSSQVVVARFDEHVDRVAPHVSAALSRQEVAQLKKWLRERASLQETLDEGTTVKTVLSALENLLQQAQRELKKVDKTDNVALKEIQYLFELLSLRLYEARDGEQHASVEFTQMPNTEVLKEQLKTLTRELGNYSYRKQ